MSRRNRQVHSVFDVNVSTSSSVDRKQKRCKQRSPHIQSNPKRSTNPKDHSNDHNFDLAIGESFQQEAQEEVDIVPSAAQKEIDSHKIKNVTSRAPVVSSQFLDADTKEPMLAPSPRPSTFFTSPTALVPAFLSPIATPTPQLALPTSVPVSSIASSPMATPLSLPSQEASNIVSPNTTMPPVSTHGPITLLTVLGSALASLLSSVFVLRARHRFVQKHGAASTRRRKRQSTLKIENDLPAGIEVQASTVETREAMDLDDESL